MRRAATRLVLVLVLGLGLGLGLGTLECSRSRPRDVRVAVPYEVDTLDPHATLTVSNFSTASNFYEPLVRTDAQLKVQPCLARSWETPDPLTWIFHLEPGVRFHDGRPLGAEDVVYSIERLLAHPELQIGFFLTGVVDATALDASTVRVHTRRALSALLNKLNFILIVPRGAAGETLAGHVDGTGPYVLGEWRKGASIRIVRNESYWGKRPALASVEYLLGRTPDQALEDLVSRRCDLVQCNSKRLDAVVQGLRGYHVLRHDSLFVKYLGYDMAHDVTPYCSVRPNPFKRRKVREALDHALDREALIASLPTRAVAATQPVPRFVFGFNPDVARPSPDTGAARGLLRAAGLPDGFPVTLHTRAILEAPARLVSAQLERVGIRAQVVVLPESEFFRGMSAGDLTFYLSRWGSTTGDAGDTLEDMFHARDPERGYGLRNWVGYANADVDGAIEQVGGITEGKLRRVALQHAMAVVMEDLPWVPLYIDEDAYALADALAWQPRHDSYVLAREIGVGR